MSKREDEPNDQPRADDPQQPAPGENDQPDPQAEQAEDETNPVEAIAEAEQAMKKLEAERDNLFERLQRVSADYQNYMRRAEQELGRATERSRGDLLKNFLPVLDHFDRALEQPPESEDGRRLHEGMKMVQAELLKVLEQAGVQRLDVAVGEPFDPHRHEALMQQEAEGVEPGHVAMAMQPGYVYGERTLRPAKVAVAPAG